MSKTHRPLKQSDTALQALLAESEARFKEALREAGQYQAQYRLEASIRKDLEEMHAEQSLILSDMMEEIRRLKAELGKFGYTFPVFSLAAVREQKRLNTVREACRPKPAKIVPLFRMEG